MGCSCLIVACTKIQVAFSSGHIITRKENKLFLCMLLVQCHTWWAGVTAVTPSMRAKKLVEKR